MAQYCYVVDISIHRMMVLNIMTLLALTNGNSQQYWQKSNFLSEWMNDHCLAFCWWHDSPFERWVFVWQIALVLTTIFKDWHEKMYKRSQTSKPTINCKNCSCVCILLCTIVVQSTAQKNSSVVFRVIFHTFVFRQVLCIGCEEARFCWWLFTWFIVIVFSYDLYAHGSVCTVAFSALTLLVAWQEGHPVRKKNGGWWRWALVSPDGVASSQMGGLSASVIFPLLHKVQMFSSGTGSPGWSQKRAVKRLCVCVVFIHRW